MFLFSIIINLLWGERRDFEINKPAKGAISVSQQNGHHFIPETMKFDFRVILLRKIEYLWDNCLTKKFDTDLFLPLKKCARNVWSKQHSAAISSSIYSFTKERLSTNRRQRGYDKLTFTVEIPRYLKEHVC